MSLSPNNHCFRITISSKENGRSPALIHSANQLNIPLQTISTHKLFFLQGSLSQTDATELATQLLVDPVTEQFTITELNTTLNSTTDYIDITLLPGVTDPPAENLLRIAHQLGYTNLTKAATGSHVELFGTLTKKDLHTLANQLFANPVIQQTTINTPITPPFVADQTKNNYVETIPLRAASEEQLLTISQERRLSLDLAEMKAIHAYFTAEKRDPTDAELEMLAQTWSEHCVHKTFRATIDYHAPLHGEAADSPPQTVTINGLLKSYIRAATEELNKPWVHSAFVDDAGIIAFDDQFDLAFKVETHNHPSALEPFGGANTGVGGVIRDVLGVSARPIANTNILCFGPPDLNKDSLPEGVLHPRRVAAGVVHGIEDYGNKMGIPTVNGAILYHEGYTANPLVYCGCLGILPRNAHPTKTSPGDLIIALGGRTGRDGLRGATFSSMEMDTATSEIAGTAVQIGHPIQEKQLLELMTKARDEQLYSALTDCGAGGFSSSIGEMAEELGATVHLERAPLKYPGLAPWEIWLSEAQERMVLSVPAEKWERLQQLALGENVEAVCLGTFNDSGRLQLFYEGSEVANLSLDFLHNGIPQRHMSAHWSPPKLTKNSPELTNYATDLLTLLAHPNIRSKEEVIRRYDHEVQGATAIKPLVGVDNHGPSDAAVLVPIVTHTKGNKPLPAAALGNGICPQFTDLDPYYMAWAAIDEAIRNVVSSGADPNKIAILDNFCWGNPNLPDRLGKLVRSAQGCYDAAIAYGTPFISGKDSLNNEYRGADNEKHAIPGTLLISAVGFVPDINKAVTIDFKRSGNILFLVGETKAELAGSHLHLVHDLSAGSVPQPNKDAFAQYEALHQAMQEELIAACHDCSEGGLAVTLAEMALAGRIGAHIELDNFSSDLTISDILFSESLSRFVVEIAPENLPSFLEIMHPFSLTELGQLIDEPTFRILKNQRSLVEYSLTKIEEAWRGHTGQKTTTPALSTTITHPATIKTNAPKVMILHANGTNRDRDAAVATELAGGQPEIVHINQLINGDRHFSDYGMLVVPGGFSYGDDLGAGVLWSLDLKHTLWHQLHQFVQSGKPVLGICNGFQTLVKAGLLPGATFMNENGRSLTLTYNQQQQFECRWVYLQPNINSNSLFIQGLTEPIYCPIAHGEGRIAVSSTEIEEQLLSQNLIALQYMSANDQPITYPANPNGSLLDIAGLSNPEGNVLGLMPHPENHIFPWQHPRSTRGEKGMMGLQLFKNGISNA